MSSSPQERATSRVTITRPANATAYTAADVVGGAITFGGVAAFGSKPVKIESTELEIDVAAIPSGMTSFTLYLYSATPPSAIADNAAWDLPSGDRATFLGSVALGTPADLGSTLYIRAENLNTRLRPFNGSTVYGYLVTAGGYTPAGNSEVYKVTLHTA